MSYLNKKYVPNDNSYAKNLTGLEDYCLAGNMLGDDPKEVLIVSEPYKEDIDSLYSGKREHEFINVLYMGDTIRVLFSEINVNKDLTEAIIRNRQVTENSQRFWDL